MGKGATIPISVVPRPNAGIHTFLLIFYLYQRMDFSGHRAAPAFQNTSAIRTRKERYPWELGFLFIMMKTL